MLIRLTLGLLLTAAAGFAQAPSLQYEVANLREDVRGMMQQVGQLTLRIEQLERENANLLENADANAAAFATVEQLSDAMADMNRVAKAAASSSKSEVLKEMAKQMSKLAKQTNAAIDALAKGMAQRPAVQTKFSDDFAMEGISYTIQKGDTLSSIAKKTNASVKDITNANKIADPTRIQVGQTLFIPAKK